MTPRKLDLYIATYSYGGNGAIASTTPDVMHWLIETVGKARADERIGRVFIQDYCDTPITMTRNRTVLDARKAGADLVLMVDSDMLPDRYLGDRGVEPFWDVALGAIYDHWEKGPLVIGAPYEGPPPNRNIYVFTWTTSGWDHGRERSETDIKLRQFTRDEAAVREGLVPCAALPTGLILFDIRAFELTEPKTEDDDPWFYYEWGDSTYEPKYGASKASTEDVTATRDIALAGAEILGYNPLRAAFSSWAGHVKQEVTGRPELLTTEVVSRSLCNAVLRNRTSDMKLRHFRSSYCDEMEKSNGRTAVAEPAST